MREKVAWAAEHEFTPPNHALKIAEAERAEAEPVGCAKCRHKSAVAKSSQQVIWISGIMAQKCHGQSSEGLIPQVLSIAPESPLWLEFAEILVGTATTFDNFFDSLSDEPISPPPRT